MLRFAHPYFIISAMPHAQLHKCTSSPALLSYLFTLFCTIHLPWHVQLFSPPLLSYHYFFFYIYCSTSLARPYFALTIYWLFTTFQHLYSLHLLYFDSLLNLSSDMTVYSYCVITLSLSHILRLTYTSLCASFVMPNCTVTTSTFYTHFIIWF